MIYVNKEEMVVRYNELLLILLSPNFWVGRTAVFYIASPSEFPILKFLLFTLVGGTSQQRPTGRNCWSMARLIISALPDHALGASPDMAPGIQSQGAKTQLWGHFIPKVDVVTVGPHFDGARVETSGPARCDQT